MNFSGFLLERGLLAELEPGTGAGNATNDVRVQVEGVAFDVEVKGLITSNPARRLTREIEDKCKKVPLVTLLPLVFFVLLVETSISSRKTKSEELVSITPDVFEGKAGVSAVVVGRMFVDSDGGPIKWSFEKILLNQSAHHVLDEKLLRKVFSPNWKQLSYPLLPIVFSYNPRTSNELA